MKAGNRLPQHRALAFDFTSCSVAAAAGMATSANMRESAAAADFDDLMEDFAMVDTPMAVK